MCQARLAAIVLKKLHLYRINTTNGFYEGIYIKYKIDVFSYKKSAFDERCLIFD